MEVLVRERVFINGGIGKDWSLQINGGIGKDWSLQINGHIVKRGGRLHKWRCS